MSLRCAPYRIWFDINPLIKEDVSFHEKGVLAIESDVEAML